VKVAHTMHENVKNETKTITKLSSDNSDKLFLL